MTIQEQWLTVNGLRVHVLGAGSGDTPVILLHGGGLDSAVLSWELLIPVLAEKRAVIAADWPGFGLSDKPDAAYSMDWYLDYFPALLDSLKFEQVDLVGLSMGGAIALGTVLRSPARVRKLVLVDSYGLQSKAPMQLLSSLLIKMRWLNRMTWNMYRGNRKLLRSSLKLLLHNKQALNEHLVDLAAEETNRPDSARAWITFQESEVTRSGIRTCYMDRLAEINQQTLIIHGRQDQAVPLACSVEANQKIRGSQLEILENCGHWPQRDQPEAFNRIVAKFLAD